MEAGHEFLARLGKKRLRPGGIVATDWLLEQTTFSKESKVLEVACNMGTSAIELAQRYGCQITGIDLDQQALEKARKNAAKVGLADKLQFLQGNALKLPFADETFDIVLNEAMLTMLPQKAKEKAVAEYFRVLKPGGVLLTHDITFFKDGLEDLLMALSRTIEVHVAPLRLESWQTLFSAAGFQTVTKKTGEMTLMSQKGMKQDEGISGMLTIVRNGMKEENRQRFKEMFRFFHNARHDLFYIAVCSHKGK